MMGMRRELEVGVKFSPTDIELVDYFLRRRMLGLLKPNTQIQECDVYKYQPWKLQELHQFPYSREMYFFAQMRRASEKESSKRARRTVDEGGYWESAASKNIYKKQRGINQKVEKVLIGRRTQLTFKIKGANNTKMATPWIMHEYHVDSASLASDNYHRIFDNLVLCKIHKKKASKDDEEEEEERQTVVDESAIFQTPLALQGTMSPTLIQSMEFSSAVDAANEGKDEEEDEEEKGWLHRLGVVNNEASSSRILQGAASASDDDAGFCKSPRRL